MDAAKKSEQERWLGHVARDGTDALVNRRGRAAQRQMANAVKGAANQWMSAPKKPDFALLGILQYVQFGREPDGARFQINAGRIFQPLQTPGGRNF